MHHSYHIFYFPFKWQNPRKKSDKFCDQTDLNTIKFDAFSNWVRSPGCQNKPEADELYNEKNYYYQFVHPTLYDTQDEETLLHHYERKELLEKSRNIVYKISIKGKEYVLKADGITLNLYSTGVGTLIFYLKNEQDDQKSEDDILKINQYGRRLFPPFIDDVANRYEIADSIAIEGLNGEQSKYRDDFSTYTNKDDWKPARFTQQLITDLAPELIIIPVIDDRMFVNCWYGNEELANEIKNKNKESFDEYFAKKDFWYKYIYVDVSFPSCKNEELRDNLLQKQTYKRWQKDGTIYGSSRYSFVMLSHNNDFCLNVLATYMRTVYSRMVELVLVQRASTLKFSEEITHVSKLSKTDKKDRRIITRICSLYEEYIRFVNQVYFREVTTQDQGIELYDLMMNTLNIHDQIKDLDGEMEELHKYASFIEERERNRKADLLNLIAAVFLPAGIAAELLGNTIFDENQLPVWSILIIIFAVMAGMYGLLQLIKKSR